MSKLIGQALKSARIQRGYTQKQVADYVGVSRVAVGQWEKGETEPATLNLINACEFLGISLAEATGNLLTESTDFVRIDGKIQEARLVRDRRAGFDNEDQDPLLHELNRQLKEVPIMGTVRDFASREPGVFVGDFSTPVGFTHRPPGFDNLKSLFALYTPTSALAPRYEVGELLFVWSLREPTIGDYVVVELHEEVVEGGHLCRMFQLTERPSNELVGRTLLPPERVSIPLESVRALHRIVPWTELFD